MKEHIRVVIPSGFIGREGHMWWRLSEFSITDRRRKKGILRRHRNLLSQHYLRLPKGHLTVLQIGFRQKKRERKKERILWGIKSPLKRKRGYRPFWQANLKGLKGEKTWLKWKQWMDQGHQQTRGKKRKSANSEAVVISNKGSRGYTRKDLCGNDNRIQRTHVRVEKIQRGQNWRRSS